MKEELYTSHLPVTSSSTWNIPTADPTEFEMESDNGIVR